MNPYISGQNSAKFGGEEIYRLAETVSDRGGKNVPTKVGVRYPAHMLEDIKGVLDVSTEMSNNLKRESAKIINFSKISLIERNIEDLRVLRYNCQGCFTDHPSQDQHMSHGGGWGVGGVWNRNHGLNKSLSTSIRCILSLREREDVDCKCRREKNGSAGAIY